MISGSPHETGAVSSLPNVVVKLVMECRKGNVPPTNHVLLVKIQGPVRYTIYHHLAIVKGADKPLYSPDNNWEKDIYRF